MVNPEFNNILIIKMSAIGDVVHTLPFLEVLRWNLPGARIDWLVEEEASDIIIGHPELNRVIISRRKSWQRRLLNRPGRMAVMGEVVDLVDDLRSRRYDLVIDLQGLFRSGVLAGLSRATRKIGMGGAREGGWLFWNERPVPVDYDRHAVDRYLQLAEHLNCRISAWKGRIPFTKAHDPGIDDLLDGGQNSGRPLVAVNPMAGWKTKLWEPLKFAALSDRLQEELSCRVVFTGSRSDRPSIEQILGAMRKPAANLAGQTSLKELAYLYSRCTALVTTDTGPMHIAAAMGCRVVALFGPTAPWRTGPYGEGHSVIRSNVECSPCFKKRCREPSCMKEITTEAVFRTVQGVLTENR